MDPKVIFNQRDANKDGKLTKDELPGPMRDRLADLDTDKDGVVTLKEFEQNMPRLFRGGPGGRGPGGRGVRGHQGDSSPKKPPRPARPALEP